MDLQFVVDQVQGAFKIDSTPSAKPLIHEVNSKDEISKIFGDITYSKGGSILRMIKMAIGEEKFKETLKLYIERK